MFLPKSKFSLCLACFLRFVLTSPRLLDKTSLNFFQFVWFLQDQKRRSWMIFPNDIMARLAAMFHAASCESKLLAQNACQTLSISSHTLAWARPHARPRAHAPRSLLKHLFLPFLFVYMFFFVSSCAAKLQLSQMMQLVHKRITMHFLKGNINKKKKFQRDFWLRSTVVLEINWNGKLNEISSRRKWF